MKSLKLSEQDIPTLGDWVNFTEGAEILGFSRQYMYKLAQHNHFKTLHKIGSQPTFVVSRAELEGLVREAVDNDAV